MLEMGTQQAASPLPGWGLVSGSGLLGCGAVGATGWWSVVPPPQPCWHVTLVSQTPLKCVPWGSF